MEQNYKLRFYGCTDLGQSRKIAEILRHDSADMYYLLIDNTTEKPIYEIGFGKYIGILPSFPAWSLSALLDALPKVNGLKPMIDLEESSIQYPGTEIYEVAYNLVDCCVQMIVKLHERKLL